MTNQKFYFTFSLINKTTKEYEGWNSEIASTKEEAIDKALERFNDPNDSYMVDESSFRKQTDNEMTSLMWATY
jgi:hypothetical protein